MVPVTPTIAERRGPCRATEMVSADSPVTATVSAALPWPIVPSASSTSATTYSTASVRRAAVTNGRSSGAR